MAASRVLDAWQAWRKGGPDDRGSPCARIGGRPNRAASAPVPTRTSATTGELSAAAEAYMAEIQQRVASEDLTNWEIEQGVALSL